MKRTHCRRYRPLLHAAWLTPASALACAVQAMEFETGFLRSEAAAAALASLSESADLPSGDYVFEVSLNGQALGQHALPLERTGRGWQVCLPLPLLEDAGVNRAALPASALVSEACVDLEQAIEGSQVTVDTRSLTVAVSVPQIAMHRRLVGATDPQTWDSGITAGFVNYQASSRQTRHRRGGDDAQRDLYLNAGVNLGGWRLRTTQAFSDGDQQTRRWQRLNTYAQRDISALRGNLTVGELFTQGDTFQSVPLRGVQLASEMDMLPDVLQAYSPVIRGVAQSRAKVEVHRDGYLLYTTYVTPGPFELDDLSVSGSGELEVSVIEEDGQVTRFTQPYSTLSNLLREGVWRYSAAVGRYAPAYANTDSPLLAQASLARGLPGNWTLYGGGLTASFYRAGQLGVSRDFGAWGALSFDTTYASTTAGSANPDSQGMSYAARYGKGFDTGTQLRFAGYRYSTEGYRDFNEAVAERSSSWLRHGSRRSRLEGALYQSLGTRTSFSLSLSREDYWGSSYQRKQLQANLSTVWKDIGINTYLSQSFDERNRQYRQWGLSASVPLGGYRTSATFNVQRSGERTTQRASLAGYHEDLRLSYRASVAQNERNSRDGSLSATYQGTNANVGAAISQGADYRSVSLNANGALVFHPGGVIAAPQVSETFAIVEVPGIEHVGLRGGTGRTNADGYAVASSLRPYRRNTVSLDTAELGPDVLIDNGTQQVTPRRGAVVKATFSGRQVIRLLLTARLPNGDKLALGTELLDERGATVGTIGQGGQALLEGTGQALTLMARWEDNGLQRCQLRLDPQAARSQEGYQLLEAVCTE